jgi:hypothetical protein
MTELEPLNIAWGARDIARVLNRPVRATFHALERGEIPGAKKVAGRWCLAIDVFKRAMEAA